MVQVRLLWAWLASDVDSKSCKQFPLARERSGTVTTVDMVELRGRVSFDTIEKVGAVKNGWHKRCT